MFNRFIRPALNKVPCARWFSKSTASNIAKNKNVFFTIIYSVTLFALQLNSPSCYAGQQQKDNRGLVFYMIYESNKPLDIQRMVLYHSQSKWINQKYDSIVIISHNNVKVPDSIVFFTGFKEPEYITLNLYIKGKAVKSNTVYASSGSTLFEATLNDTELKVRPKLAEGSLINQNSLQGLALILQAILEMIIAWIILKAFGLPRQIILMVLAANIAAFPLYLLHLPNTLTTEILVFITKAVVMIIIGLRKMPVYRTVILLVALTIIGFGFKELFFFIAKMI